MPKRAAAIALLLVTAVAAAGPIRSYDFFWHLAAGRWIVDHFALPLYDPFALASARVPWINGEWLWEVVACAAQSIAGFRGISLLNAVFAGVIFTAAFWFAARESDAGVALLISAVAFAGAVDRLGIRPAAAAALLIVAAIALLASHLTVPRMAIAYGVLSVVWINTHPSALLAPILAATTLLIDIRRWVVVVASALALLINPFGWRAVTSPFALTKLATSGAFVNTEWLPSSPVLFPLLYVTILVFGVALAIMSSRREHVWRFLTFAILAVLAMQHVRNQSLYFAALPLLFPPVRPLSPKHSLALGLCAIVPLGWAFAISDHALGIDTERFPTRAVLQLQRAALRGNIYNADQFGGYLEWTMYPERCVVTDGRNELFRDFIAEDARARRDSRVWHALLRTYAIDLAVDEYQSGRMEVVDVARRQRRFLPASLVRYPRRDWALIAFDDAAMIFARRDAFPPAVVARLEYRYLVPDDPHASGSDAAARMEVQRARREVGDLRVVRELEEGTGD